MPDQAPNIDLGKGGGRLVYDKAPRTIVAKREPLKDLRNALLARDQATAEINEILKRDFPPGTPIHFEDRKRVYSGVVVMNGYGGRICVRNNHTGRERW